MSPKKKNLKSYLEDSEDTRGSGIYVVHYLDGNGELCRLPYDCTLCPEHVPDIYELAEATIGVILRNLGFFDYEGVTVTHNMYAYDVFIKEARELDYNMSAEYLMPHERLVFTCYVSMDDESDSDDDDDDDEFAFNYHTPCKE